MAKFPAYAVALALAGSTSTPGATAQRTCGASDSICTFVQQDTLGLYKCLSEKFGDDTIEYRNTTVGSAGSGAHGKYAPSPLDSADDGSLYYKARRVSWGLRNPAAVVFAEGARDVADAVNCARENGYRVSPRGRGHSTIGAAAADGALVIDLQYTCDVGEMVASIDRTRAGAHLVDGTRYIATIRAQAGCANANWLAAVYAGFDADEGAMASIGTCPSVGLVGYSLGGGVGDSTPIAGFAADLITEYEMVLADGSVVTASESENEDLYWANRGGGGGNGVITSMTLKVVQNPSPGRSFSFVVVVPSEAGRAEWIVRFRDFLYDHPESYRFGGSSQLTQTTLLFLGPMEEGIEILTGAGLLDQDLMDPATTTQFYLRDFEPVCTPGNCAEPFPPAGIVAGVQTRKQAEAQAFIICMTWLTGWHPDATGRSRDVCRDLGVDDGYCECVAVGDDECYAKSPTYYTCGARDVTDAMLEAATVPSSFMCHHGYDVKVDDVSDRDWPLPTQTGNMGGLLLPRLSDETLRDLAKNNDNPLMGAHLTHGASHEVPTGATALPWRKASHLTDGAFTTPNNMGILLKDEAFGGDQRNVNGYYSYVGPEGLPNWEEVYFGGHVQRLKEIKARYDPTGLFDKPMQISGSNTNPPNRDGGVDGVSTGTESGNAVDDADKRNEDTDEVSSGTEDGNEISGTGVEAGTSTVLKMIRG